MAIFTNRRKFILFCLYFKLFLIGASYILVVMGYGRVFIFGLINTEQLHGGIQHNITCFDESLYLETESIVHYAGAITFCLLLQTLCQGKHISLISL